MSRQILPCWCAHARMGHSVLYGYAESYAGTSILLTVPAIEGDDQHSPLDEEVHVLPMEGPAFYGFEVLTEDGVRARLASKRPWKPRAFLPAPAEEDAVEVSAEEPALDCKPIGTLLREFTADDLDALPEGSTFFDGDDSWTRKDDKWVSDAQWLDCDHTNLIDTWRTYPYRLTRIGPAPIVQAAPISSDVRPAAAVGQRVFVGGLSPNTAGWYNVASASTEGVILDNGDGTLSLTPEEWSVNVATVLDSNGVTLFDEMPF